MVDLRRYKPEDYDVVKGWYEARSLKAPLEKILPNVGLIAEDVACGFLYVAEGKIGWFDFFITNKGKDKLTRLEAIDRIGHSLLVYAKMAGIHGVMCNTQIEPIKDLAVRYGLVDIGNFTMFFKGF